MNPVFLAIVQVLSFLAANKDALKSLVLRIEELIPDAPGAVKSAQVKAFIAAALGVEAQIEAVWPLVAGIFAVFVAKTKGTPPTP